VTIRNAAVAEHACELAETSGGLRRMAALCVSAAAATTSSFRSARKALEIIPHSGLRDAAQLLLAELSEEPAAEEPAAAAALAAEPVAAASSPGSD
jgi:hypothetical protein